jgi:hypothetical protein
LRISQDPRVSEDQRDCRDKYVRKPHLRDGAEAKDLRVANARHVGQHVRNVLERVGHKVIEAREAGGRTLVVVLELAEVGRVVLPAIQRAEGCGWRMNEVEERNEKARHGQARVQRRNAAYLKTGQNAIIVLLRRVLECLDARRVRE